MKKNFRVIVATLMLMAVLMVAVTTSSAGPYGKRAFYKPNVIQNIGAAVYHFLPVRTQISLRVGLPDNVFFTVFGCLDSYRCADGD